MGDNVLIASGHVMNMGNPLTSVAAGDWVPKGSPFSAIQTTVAGAGTVSATVVIEVSNDGVNAVATSAGTITLSGASPQSDGFITSGASWKFIRQRVTAISGTNATVSTTIGN